VYVVLAALILMVLLFGPNLGNRTLLGTLILLVLVVAGVEVLRRRILAEFPPEPRPAEPAPA
jgi:cell division protein FtsW (lipid II flippase)